MPHIPNIPARRFALTRKAAAIPDAWLPYPYVDTLYDHTQFLSPTQPIATFATDKYPVANVAIVGAGAGGMVAAYELLRAGVQPTVFEATDRIGGRTWSEYFEKQSGEKPPVWAEMGAMRVPLSQKLFWYYANQFGAKIGDFPDPGVAPTLLYYENQPYWWQPHTPPPGPFAKIQADFGKFASRFIRKIWTPWYNGGGEPYWEQVAAVWQSYIDHYREMSVYDAVRKGIRSWSDEELNAFSALGVGSGGFGTLYRVGNLELLRNMINKWEYEQQLIVGWEDTSQAFISDGINGLTHMLYNKPVQWRDGQTVSLESLDAVAFNSTVTQIERDADSQQLKVHWTDKTNYRENVETFSAVIIAAPTRSMEIDIGMTLPRGNDVDVGSEDVKNAMRNLYLIGSSKMLIRTASKFWRDEQGMARADIPQSLQTDELPRGVYCLDYPHTDEGIVIISYTWGDDSTKLTAMEPVERFEKFKEILTSICPPFGENLLPANGERDILNVDWEATEHYYGAFKLQLPGQDHLLHVAYYHFLSVLDPASDGGVYLAGDSVSWSGGWVEGALQTGINAACAVAKRLGGTLRDNSPLSQNPNRYRYGG